MKKRKLFRKFSILSPVLMTLLMSVQVQAVDDLSSITAESEQRVGIVTVTDMEGNVLTPPPMPRIEIEQPVVLIDREQIAADLDASMQESMQNTLEDLQRENEENLQASIEKSMQDMMEGLVIEEPTPSPISRDIAEQDQPIIADDSAQEILIPEVKVDMDNQSIEDIANSLISEEIGEEVAQVEVVQEEVAGEEVAQEEVVQEEVAQEEVVQEEIAQEEVAQEEVAQEEVVQEEVVQEEVAQVEVVQEEIATDDTPSQDDIVSLAFDAQESLDENLNPEENSTDEQVAEVEEEANESDDAALEEQVSDAAENADELRDIAEAGDELSDEEKEAVLDQIEVDEETIEELEVAVEETEENDDLQAQLDEAKEKLAEAREALAESEANLAQARTYFEQITCNQQTQISDLTSQIEAMRSSMFADIQAMMMPMFMNMMTMMQDSQLTQFMERGYSNSRHSSGNSVATSLGLDLLSLSDIYSATGGRGGITINNYSVGGSFFGGDYANTLTNGQMPRAMGPHMSSGMPFGFNFNHDALFDGQRFGQMDSQNPAAVSHLVGRTGASVHPEALHPTQAMPGYTTGPYRVDGYQMPPQVDRIPAPQPQAAPVEQTAAPASQTTSNMIQ